MRNMKTTYTFIHTQLIVLAVDPFPYQPQSPHGPGLPPTAPGPVDPPPVRTCPHMPSLWFQLLFSTYLQSAASSY